MLQLATMVWGGPDVARGVEFWKAALDYVNANEPADDWVLLKPRDADWPQLAIEHKTSDHQRRHHMDLYADNQTQEVERLVGLGATRVEWDYEHDADYVVLADPNGNTFCVVQK